MTSTEIDTGGTAAPRDLREQILSAVRKGHSVTLDAFKVVVDRAAPVTTKIPTVNVTFPEKLPLPDKLPYSDKIPTRDDVREFAGKIPSRETVVTNVRELAGQLLAEQRKFNGEFRKTAAALRPAPEKAAERTSEVTPEGTFGGTPEGTFEV